jgi:hypothetical protein
MQVERADQLGTQVASELIVGESLWGVINAGLIARLSKNAPIGLVPEDFAFAPWLARLGVVRDHLAVRTVVHTVGGARGDSTRPGIIVERIEE